MPQRIRRYRNFSAPCDRVYHFDAVHQRRQGVDDRRCRAAVERLDEPLQSVEKLNVILGLICCLSNAHINLPGRSVTVGTRSGAHVNTSAHTLGLPIPRGSPMSNCLQGIQSHRSGEGLQQDVFRKVLLGGCTELTINSSYHSCETQPGSAKIRYIVSSRSCWDVRGQ